MKIIVNKILNTTSVQWFGGPLSSATPTHSRRQFIGKSTAVAVAIPAAMSGWVYPRHAYAQGSRSTAAKSVVVAQIVDTSLSQQDISKDFLIGSRAAWQDINARGGIKGRAVSHLAIETDGTPQTLKAAWTQVRDNPACVVVSGASADPLANQFNSMLFGDDANIANVASWLQNSSVELHSNTFSVFSSRQEQIAYSLKSLSTLGMKKLAVVFASASERQQNFADVKRISQTLGLDLQEFPITRDLSSQGQKLDEKTPAVILFIGGTPELAQFAGGLEKQARQRFLVGLADVNLQTLQQLGVSKNTPIIVTQAVPTVNSSDPIVRLYKQVMAKLYDEPPTPLSLAGFIAARYTYEVMNSIESPLTRASVLAAFERRQNINVGGFRVTYEAQRRSSTYVTQSMLSPEGRVIG
jgi:ABC-type branched-subunit amino acid transport system substrate-binding protein